MNTFQAMVAKQLDGRSSAALETLTEDALPEGDVLVDVKVSSLNYKDGLAITGKGKVIRKFPMICGIDLAGVVRESRSPLYREGDQVVVTGWGIGESHHGGYSQVARLKSEWLIPLPSGMTLSQSMALGTAGVTAMMAVMGLEEAGVKPSTREVVVTGAAGGVGSLAVAILAKLGHRVVASTGRPELGEFLKGLGATDLIARAVLSQKGPPLGTERWGGAVDTVGGQTLATILAQTAQWGAVAACGLAGGAELSTTVFPFILRGVSLLGINSLLVPKERRLQIWQRLLSDVPPKILEGLTRVEPMSKLPELAEEILSGKIRGRVVVDVNA